MSARSTPGGQRRGRQIAMSPAEVDRFLAEQRVCRLASLGARGPHVSPVWFVWVGGLLWIYSITRSQRWADLEKDERVAGVVDAGDSYEELRGVELRGRIEVVGEVPRTGVIDDPRLVEVEVAYARKYRGKGKVEHDGRHAWLVLVPKKLISWDFRKLGTVGERPPR